MPFSSVSDIADSALALSETTPELRLMIHHQWCIRQIRKRWFNLWIVKAYCTGTFKGTIFFQYIKCSVYYEHKIWTSESNTILFSLTWIAPALSQTLLALVLIWISLRMGKKWWIIFISLETRGPGGADTLKKSEVQRSRATVPLKHHYYKLISYIKVVTYKFTYFCLVS